MVWYADYEAWGNTATVGWREQVIDNVKVSQDELQPIRFRGQSFDTETGLHYNRFRYFDPDMGMFTTRDPIGLLGGTNVFQYAPNPIEWVDPFGLSGYKNVSFEGSPNLYQVTGDQRNIVKTTMQGTRTRDFTQANKAANLPKTPSGYTWHHVADFNSSTGETSMQLVKRSAHEATYPHAGSASQFAKEFNVKYDSPEAVRVASDKGWLKGRPLKPKCT